MGSIVEVKSAPALGPGPKSRNLRPPIELDIPRNTPLEQVQKPLQPATRLSAFLLPLYPSTFNFPPAPPIQFTMAVATRSHFTTFAVTGGSDEEYRISPNDVTHLRFTLPGLTL